MEAAPCDYQTDKIADLPSPLLRQGYAGLRQAGHAAGAARGRDPAGMIVVDCALRLAL